MTTFLNGPAKDQHLMLKRAPVFLRVTYACGKWDALDQLGDTPRAEEMLHCYRIEGEPGMCHINMGSKGGGFYAIAQYKHVTAQPSDEQMRSQPQWEAWCQAEGTKLPQAYVITPARDGQPETREPYQPPQLPVRGHWIVERATGCPVLNCGGRGRLLDREGEGAETRYRILKEPHDWMHATAMTVEEAKANCAKWGLDHKLFKITNQKPTP